MSKSSFRQKSSLCKHEHISTTYFRTGECATSGCYWTEVKCLDCGAYITKCDCGFYNSVDGWSCKRRNYLPRKLQTQKKWKQLNIKPVKVNGK